MKPVSLYEFGSSEDVVRQLQKPFVKFFRDSGPVLDIGCGRGIFLQLLSAAGIEAIGIDNSDEAMNCCLQKGFAVEKKEARAYLSKNPGRFGGIFCSHVIEHLEYDDAMTLLSLCHSALRSDGTLVLMTPNPEDLMVISELFWLDPTHVRPYPKELLKSMLRASRFEIVSEKQFLGSWRLIGRRNLVSYFFRRMLLGKYFGKPNTLVVARKPSEHASVT